MYWFRIVLYIFLFWVGAAEASTLPVWKLIVSGDTNASVAEEDLLKLKVYLLENNMTRLLKNRYQFETKIEHLAEYSVVVISPVEHVKERNMLLVLLKPLFPDIFYIDTKHINAFIHKQTTVLVDKSTPSVVSTAESNTQRWLGEIGLQWLVIWILAVVGLILSVRNRRRVSHLKERQQTMTENQNSMEKEIGILGEKDA